jgi:MoaA/NifB/PqqE/SkfB family radical SAM enzyme
MKDITTVEIFGKSVDVKGYCCTEKPEGYIQATRPKLTLFLKLTNDCNGTCAHCTNQVNKTDKGASDIDYGKLEKTVSFLSQNNYLSRIAITGGEPGLYLDALDNVLDVISRAAPRGTYISMNTNGTNLLDIPNLRNKDMLSNVVLSRNHYDDARNSRICGIQAPSKKDILEFEEKLDKPGILQFNCLFIKDQIDSSGELEKYLDFADGCNIEVCGFASLHPVNRYAVSHHVSATPIFEGLPDKKFITTNHAYDRDACECMNGIYIGPSGSPLKLYWRELKKLGFCGYSKLLIYDNNTLKTDFNGGDTIEIR